MATKKQKPKTPQLAMQAMLSALFGERTKPSSATSRVLGIKSIESVVSPDAPCISLQLFSAQEFVFNSFREPQFSVFDPPLIGIPALVSLNPGMSQQDVADLMGLERAPAGVHVRRCIEAGLVRREGSKEDARKYRLFITAKGTAHLEKIRKLVPAHEDHCFGALSKQERATLYALLDKLVKAQSDVAAVLTPLEFKRKGASAR